LAGNTTDELDRLGGRSSTFSRSSLFSSGLSGLGGLFLDRLFSGRSVGLGASSDRSSFLLGSFSFLGADFSSAMVIN